MKPKVETHACMIDARAEIVEHAARAFFACAWSEQTGESLSGCEILDVMPSELDPAARKAAEKLASDMESRYGASLVDLLARAQAHPHRYADRPCDAEHFGHYLAMQAMSTGVGLESVCDSQAAFPRGVPWLEFSALDLDPDTYPLPEHDQ